MTTVSRSPGLRVRELSPDEVSRWDHLVRQFHNHRVVHTQAWIRSLANSGFGRPRYLVVEKAGRVVGCMPGLLSEIGPIRLFGSPPPASQTASMGPVFDHEQVTTSELMAVLVPFLEHQLGVDHTEIMSPDLDSAAMQELGFAGEPWPTYRVRLFPRDEARTLKTFKESARRNINRGIKLGLQVRFENDETFVDEHYEQIKEVYVRGGHAVNFRRQRVLECFRQLRDSGNLVAVSVTLPQDATVIATGMFTIEGTELLLWTWAHRGEHRWYRATELMTWRVMQRAMGSGCETFDLMGLGDFKTKFGAELDHRKYRWVKSRYRWLTGMRNLAARGLQLQQSMRGRIVRWRATALRELRRPASTQPATTASAEI